MSTEKKLTAMQELRNHIKDMINNGGDDDLMCVIGLINDKFLELENQQIIDAFNDASLEGEKMGTIYYETEFKN